MDRAVGCVPSGKRSIIPDAAPLDREIDVHPPCSVRGAPAPVRVRIELGLPMLKSEIRRDEYRARAEQAFALAVGSVLFEVRRKHETAAAVWTALADAEDASRARTIEAIARAPRRARPATAG